MAVTDSNFRVLGPVDSYELRRPRKPIRGLRVVDASIFPSIPGYFIVSNIYCASEKAADLIHDDWLAATQRKQWPKMTGKEHETV